MIDSIGKPWACANVLCLMFLLVSVADSAARAQAGQQAPVVEDAIAQAMLTLAGTTAGDVVFDFGSGSDIVVNLVTQQFKARGVQVPAADLLTVDVSKASVALLALPVGIMDRVGAKLKRQMAPGSRIVSRRFGIGSWKPDTTTRTADGTVLFLWTVPKRPAREPDILFVPTREAIADQMLQLAGITSKDVVYDLGSGDGRIVNLAAQKYGARGVGIEIDPPLVEIARQVAREAGVADRATFIEADLFMEDLSKATIVTIYLSPSVNRRLEPKLRKELRSGTRIVSHQFPIGNWKPDSVVPAEDGTSLYLWTVK